MGVYTRVALAKGEVVLEYTGEIVRPAVADVREARYSAAGVGTYFFALGNGQTLDATRRGSIARFINHSCM
jgi:SET domain-containing protein